jgi:hypothetical protein
MILKAMLAVVLLLVEPPMPDRSKVMMTQTKRCILVLQVRGFGAGLTSPPLKINLLQNFKQASE